MKYIKAKLTAERSLRPGGEAYYSWDNEVVASSYEDLEEKLLSMHNIKIPKSPTPIFIDVDEESEQVGIIVHAWYRDLYERKSFWEMIWISCVEVVEDLPNLPKTWRHNEKAKT